jgi:hypothetical protein
MFVKIYKSYRDIVVISDSELLGKKFEEGNFQLDVKENFYNGNKKSEDEVREIMEFFSKEDAVFNIVGKKSVKLALETGIIEESGIKRIGGIPFSFVLL